MIKTKILAGALAIALVLEGCSSRPREFTPRLAATPASTEAFDAAQAECSELLVAGKLDRSGRLASGAAGAAAGGAVMAGGAAAATSAGLYGGMAVASATIVLIPFAVIGGAWGMARAKRASKEKAIKTALAGCLKERGFEVAGWAKAGKKAKAVKAAPAAS